VVAAELLKLRTVRSGLLALPVAVLLTLWAALDPVVSAGRSGSPSLGTAGALLAVLGACSRGSYVSLVAGAVIATSDIRHGTVTSSLLVTPRRSAVLAAQAVVAVLVAVVVAAADLLVVLAVGLLSGAVDPAMVNPDIVLRIAGLLLACPLYALLGVGLGALLRSQPLAVLLPVAWLAMLENLLVPPALAAWSVGGVTAALGNSGDVAGALPVLAGGGLLAAYAAAALAAGSARLVRQDIP
jgi:ABC-2 type transport system permease protein